MLLEKAHAENGNSTLFDPWISPYKEGKKFKREAVDKDDEEDEEEKREIKELVKGTPLGQGGPNVPKLCWKQ